MNTEVEFRAASYDSDPHSPMALVRVSPSLWRWPQQAWSWDKTMKPLRGQLLNSN